MRPLAETPSKGRASVRWLGHSTVVIDLHGVRLLTDPLLRRHVGPLRRATVSPQVADWADPDAALISHLHYDHADLPSLRALARIPLLASPSGATWLGRRGLHGQRTDHQWLPVTPEGTVEVLRIQAVHHSRPMPHRPNDAHGFLIRSPLGVVWFAGDTARFDGMTALPELAEGPIDLALLPIHGWGPRLSGGHLDPTGAAEVCAMVRPRQVLPIHHGTFHPIGLQLRSLAWMWAPLAEFRRELARHAPRTELIDVQPCDPTIQWA